MKTSAAPRAGFGLFLDRAAPEILPVSANAIGKLPKDKTVEVEGVKRTFWRWHYRPEILKSLMAKKVRAEEDRNAVLNGTEETLKLDRMREQLAALEAKVEAKGGKPSKAS